MCRVLDNKALCVHCRPMMMETEVCELKGPMEGRNEVKKGAKGGV